MYTVATRKNLLGYCILRARFMVEDGYTLNPVESNYRDGLTGHKNKGTILYNYYIATPICEMTCVRTAWAQNK